MFSYRFEILLDQELVHAMRTHSVGRISPKNVEEFLLNQGGSMRVHIIRNKALVKEPNMHREDRLVGPEVTANSSGPEPTTGTRRREKVKEIRVLNRQRFLLSVDIKQVEYPHGDYSRI